MQGHVRLLDPLGSNHYWARQLYDWHIESNTGWGWDQFLSLDELQKVRLANFHTSEYNGYTFGMGAFVTASLLGFLLRKTIHDRKSVVTQRQCQWLVPAGKGRPMQGRAEFLSRPGGGGLWNSARTVPSSTGSPSNGLLFYIPQNAEPEELSKEEYEEVTRETTREAMAGLAASPGFSDRLIEHADRINLLPDESYDDEMGSESDSTGEQSCA
ncbi:hypothetical protein F2Q68_00041117, partial [Brassica cretica]